MRCPRCQGATMVLDSRSAESLAGKIQWLSGKVREAMPEAAGVSNFRVRQRECVACKRRCVSVEMLLPDIEVMPVAPGSAMAALTP